MTLINCKICLRKRPKTSHRVLFATCHMHVTPCCIAQRAAEAALQARFTWAFGGLTWLGLSRCVKWLYLSLHLCPSGSPYWMLQGKSVEGNTSSIAPAGWMKWRIHRIRLGLRHSRCQQVVYEAVLPWRLFCVALFHSPAANVHDKGRMQRLRQGRGSK